MGTNTRPYGAVATIAAAIAFGALLMQVSGPYYQSLLITVLLFAYWAVAWNVLGGLAGQISFGHAAFVGAGAYTSSILFVRFGINPWFGMLVGGTIAALLGLFVGYLSFRYGLRDIYFALITTAFGQVIFLLVANSDYHGLFGGQGGLRFPIVEPSVLVYQFPTKLGYYLVIACLLTAALGLTWWMRRSKLGYYLIAVRENERSAQASGINIMRYKLIATAISAFLAALGGTFYAQYYLFIDPPSVLDAHFSVVMLLPAIVGGTDTVFGPLVGAAILIPISEEIRNALSGGFAGVHLVVYGLVIILVMRLIPRGLLGWITDRKWFSQRTPKPQAPPVDAGNGRA